MAMTAYCSTQAPIPNLYAPRAQIPMCIVQEWNCLMVHAVPQTLFPALPYHNAVPPHTHKLAATNPTSLPCVAGCRVNCPNPLLLGLTAWRAAQHNTALKISTQLVKHQTRRQDTQLQANAHTCCAVPDPCKAQRHACRGNCAAAAVCNSWCTVHLTRDAPHSRHSHDNSRHSCHQVAGAGAR